MFILALKRPKKRIFGSKFWSHRRQKCYRNPFLGHFETPKEYGRHCHRYLGKVKFFRVIWITKRCQKCDFCSGRALKAPPSCRVNRKINMIVPCSVISRLHKLCHRSFRIITEYFYNSQILIEKLQEIENIKTSFWSA